MIALLAVAVGGGLGTVARYLLNNAVTLWLGKSFPYGILCINVVGSFCIGMAFVYFSSRLPASENWRLLVVVGFLGAFTTFSTFSLDTIQLLHMGEHGKSFLNMGLNLFLCLGACWLGIFLMKTI